MNLHRLHFPHFLVLFVFPLIFLGCGDDDNSGIDPGAATGQIQGSVRDAVTGEPIGQVTITTTPASQSVTTAADGTFLISAVIPTQYVVKAEKAGYASKSVTIQVISGTATQADLLLENRNIGVAGDSIYALELTNDYGVVADDPAFDLSSGSFTVEATVYANNLSASGWHWLVNHGTSNSDLDYLLGFENARPLFSIRSRATVLKSDDKLIAGRWYHIAGVVDSENSLVSLYVDGVLVKQGALKGSGVATQGNLFIGARESLGSGIGTEFFNGFIREVRLWNHARSAMELQQTIGTLLGGAESGLVGYWPLSDGEGITFKDYSAYGRNGTLLGTPRWLRILNPW